VPSTINVRRTGKKERVGEQPPASKPMLLQNLTVVACEGKGMRQLRSGGGRRAGCPSILAKDKTISPC